MRIQFSDPHEIMQIPPSKKRPRGEWWLEPLKLELDGLSKQDALKAICDFFSVCQQRARRIDLPRALEQIRKHLSKNLQRTQSKKLELDIGDRDWQAWGKYKKALSDFQTDLMEEWRTRIIEDYESLNRVAVNNPYIASDNDFYYLASKIQLLTNNPPVGIDAKYWYGITPHGFTAAESRRAIDKVNQLHQEYQWATHGEGGDAVRGLWLFVWRMLKKMWLVYNLEGHNFPVAVAAAVSQLEKPFLDANTDKFNHMNRTFEILHQPDIEEMVFSFAVRCYGTFPAPEKERFVKSVKLDNATKECLHAFIHGKTELTAKVLGALRETAARYLANYVKQRKEESDFQDKMSDDEESVEEAPVEESDSEPESRNVFPMPIALARKSHSDYVWYDLPDTRAREFAESRRVDRDMTTPGIYSDGLRISELVNVAPFHARRPGQVSRWKRFYPIFGPVSLPFRLVQYWLNRKRLIRPAPKTFPRIAPRQMTRPSKIPTSRDAPLGSPLSATRNKTHRVTKPNSPLRMPAIKLRGGGSKSSSPAWRASWSAQQARLIAELGKKVGIDQPTVDQANYLVGTYLTATHWNVSAAEELWQERPIQPNKMRYDVADSSSHSGSLFENLSQARRRLANLVLAALDSSGSFNLTEQDIIAALEDQDWRWEAALVDLRGDRHADGSQRYDVVRNGTTGDDSLFSASSMGSEQQEPQKSPVASSPRRQRSRSRSKSRTSAEAEEHDYSTAKGSGSNASSNKSGQPNSRCSGSKSSNPLGGRLASDGIRGAQSFPSSARLRSKSSEPLPGSQTTPQKQLPINDPKRQIHAGPQGYTTDSRPSDDEPEEITQIAAEGCWSPSQAAVARRIARQRMQAQQSEVNGVAFDIYSDPIASPSKSGLEDRIDDFDNEPMIRPASVSPFDKEDLQLVMQMDCESSGLCHPCPQYDGLYHHQCNDLHCGFGIDVGRSSGTLDAIQGGEPIELPLPPAAAADTVLALVRAMDSDIKAVTARCDDKDSKLNEVQIHARLQRLLRVAEAWSSRTGASTFAANSPVWEQFLLPDEIEPAGPLGYDAWRTCHSAWIHARSPGKETALQDIYKYIKALIEYHYARNSPDRCANSSDETMRVETFRSFPHYYRQAKKLKRDLNGLADLFAEIDGFSGMEYRRSNHGEHHDFFRGAYCGLLSLRRGIGHVVPEAECDNAPCWVQYKGQGQAPFPEIHAWVKKAVAATELLIEFFWSGDSEVDFSDSVEYLQETIGNLRDILYRSLDRITPHHQASPAEPPARRSSSLRRSATPSRLSQSSTKRKSVEANDDIDNGPSTNPTPRKRKRIVPQSRARILAKLGALASTSKGSSSGKSLSSSDKENKLPPQKVGQVLQSIEQDDEGGTEQDEGEQEEEIAAVEEESDDEGSEESEEESDNEVREEVVVATPKPALKANFVQKPPTSEDYHAFMYVDEIKDEIKHRGITVQGKNIKANLVNHLIAADKDGNTGFGVMRSWRKFNGKKATDKRPDVYKPPTEAQIKKKFKDRLV